MCVFLGRKMVEETGLLDSAEAFTFPVGETFPGEVMICWRKWGLRTHVESEDQWALRSTSFRTKWEPGKVLVADRLPDVKTGHGIYGYGRPEDVETAYGTWGSIALWGRVLNFPETDRRQSAGCMGQFAYPLEINLVRSMSEGRARAFAAAWTPTGTEVFYRGVKL